MSVTEERQWLATSAQGFGPLLVEELQALGAVDVAESAAGVQFTGAGAVMYRACLWSRLASRIYLPLWEGRGGNAESLYEAVVAQPWHTLIADDASIAVDFQGTNASIRDSRFGAQRSKDAIVDSLRAAGRAKPRVDPATADFRVSIRLREDNIAISIDMVGESLHRRGYRKAAGSAPLKEHLAAALLLRAQWPEMAARGGALIDPLCGSGTLLIEGAFIAGDRAPSLNRERFTFRGWRHHNEAQWQALRGDARGRAEHGLADMPEIRGYDGDPRVVSRAQENIAEAGLSKVVRVSVKALREVKKPTHKALPEGLLICNPPYGERLGDAASLGPLYRSLGELMHDEFPGWKAAVLTGDKDLGRATGLRSHRQYAFWNGRIPVSLLLFDLQGNRLSDSENKDATQAVELPQAVEQPQADDGDTADAALSNGAQMFANRLQKNQRHLKKWLRRSPQECYRLYDADMPEYAVAVDRYGDWLHVAEYRAPETVDENAAAKRMAEAMAALPAATGVPPERIVVKSRQRQRGKEQYERQGKSAQMLSVSEGEARFLVNLHDYLDTGLFLDHRALRRRISAEAKGMRFLNLFCYTGSATVQAALGGAKRCVSVDLSNTYLAWLRKNIGHNGLAEAAHEFVRADCMQWLKEGSTLFDLVMLDPPSFSNSSRMQESFDIQRDHAGLIEAAMARLAPEGKLYFSCNRRRFRLAEALEAQFDCTDITEETLDPDFPRRPPAHRCWQFRHARSEP